MLFLKKLAGDFFKYLKKLKKMLEDSKSLSVKRAAFLLEWAYLAQNALLRNRAYDTIFEKLGIHGK